MKSSHLGTSVTISWHPQPGGKTKWCLAPAPYPVPTRDRFWFRTPDQAGLDLGSDILAMDRVKMALCAGSQQGVLWKVQALKCRVKSVLPLWSPGSAAGGSGNT